LLTLLYYIYIFFFYGLIIDFITILHHSCRWYVTFFYLVSNLIFFFFKPNTARRGFNTYKRIIIIHQYTSPHIILFCFAFVFFVFSRPKNDLFTIRSVRRQGFRGIVNLIGLTKCVAEGGVWKNYRIAFLGSRIQSSSDQQARCKPLFVGYLQTTSVPFIYITSYV